MTLQSSQSFLTKPLEGASLVFSINVLAPVKTISWIGYSLDGKANITLSTSSSCNLTVANIANGHHIVAVYANDTYGNMGIQTASFRVEKPVVLFKNLGDAVPAAIIAITIAILCLAMSLLLYRGHRQLVKKS